MSTSGFSPGHRALPRIFANPKESQLAEITQLLFQSGSKGLAEDIRYYGQWMHDEAEKRIGYLYPKIEITTEAAKGRPDLKSLIGSKLTVIVWIWARTVRSPNPAFAHVHVPLIASFMLSTKADKQVYVELKVKDDEYDFVVKLGEPKNPKAARSGTKLARGNFQCCLSGSPISSDYIKTEAQAGRLGTRLMAVVADSDLGRIYLSPTSASEEIARSAKPEWKPDVEFFQQALGFRVGNYGMKNWSDLYTSRQLAALTTFSDLVKEARKIVLRDTINAGVADNGETLASGGTGATAYADAIATYLGITASKAARFITTLSTWRPDETKLSRAFARNDIPMTWDFAETNPFSGTGGDFGGLAEGTAAVTENAPVQSRGFATIADACSPPGSSLRIISTDPPYFDNVGYADLSDYFYVWLRPTLKSLYPDLFATLVVPKADELVATPARHGGKEKAEEFFLQGMTRAMYRLVEEAHPGFPVTIYYAFKQAESEGDGLTANTGWDTFLSAVIQAGFAITGTWPVRTEGKTRMRSMGSNALASSIVLVCHPRPTDAPSCTRREFLVALKAELPNALIHLQRGNIAPVDLAQAAIGPGMAVYTRFARVLDAQGEALSVRDALALINQTLDESLAEQEGDFDADSRWAVAWFEQSGFAEGDYGVAEMLSKAKNTSVSGMVDANILASNRGKVRLLKPSELPIGWDPVTDPRLTAWEMVHQLVRSLESGGEHAAATLVGKLGNKAEIARELAYRLYVLCERRKRAAEALSYNGLVQSWPEISRLARENVSPPPTQPQLI